MMASFPSFASASLPPIKALAWQTPLIGGGASFSLYFPKVPSSADNFLVSLASYEGWFQRPEGFYYPSSLENMPVGWERYESFLVFQKEMNAFLFPFFIAAFPLAESLGEEGFLSSVLPYSQTYERKKAWLSLPDRKSAEKEEA